MLLNTALADARVDNAGQIAATVGSLPLPALGELMLPFVWAVRRSLEEESAVTSTLPAPVLDSACLSLLQLLCHYATGVFFLEYRIAGGATASRIFLPGGDRDGYREFSERMLSGGVKQVLLEYPLLTRMLIGACRSFSTMVREVPLISPALRGRSIAGLSLYLSDLHEGRSVYALTLDDGSSLHVKPRGCLVEQWLTETVEWLRSQPGCPSLVMPGMETAGAHTLCASVQHVGCGDAGEVELNFESAGSWLCIFRHLHVSDMHCANIVACGAHPVPVDVETLLQPDVPWQSPLHPLFATDFVPPPSGTAGVGYFTAMGHGEGALLPHTRLHLRHQDDGFGLDSEPYRLPGYPSLPHIGGVVHHAADHAASFLRGYRTMYQLLLDHRELLVKRVCELPARHVGRTRYVFRHTGTYNRLQQLLLQPHCLRNGDFAGMELERLAARCGGDDGKAALIPIIDAEIRSLSIMDIPIFYSSSDECSIRDSNDDVVATYSGQTPIDRVVTTLKKM